MIDEISKSVKAALYDRTASPLFGAFIASWILWNWKLIVIFLSGMKGADKIEHIVTILYANWPSSVGLLFLGPLITATIFIYLYPIPAKYVFEYTRNQHKKLKEIKVNIEDETPLSQEEHNRLRQKLSSLEASYYAELASKDSEIERLRSLIESVKPQANDLSPKPQVLKPDRVFPLSDTSQPMITEITIKGEKYSIGKEILKSRPGETSLLKIRSIFNYQEKIDVSFKTNKPIIAGQFYEVFDGHSHRHITDQNFQIHKIDYENKNATIAVLQPNPSKSGSNMVISNKIQFRY